MGLAAVFAGLEVAPLVSGRLRGIQELIMKLLPQFTSPEPAQLPTIETHFERLRKEKTAIIVRQRGILDPTTRMAMSAN